MFVDMISALTSQATLSLIFYLDDGEAQLRCSPTKTTE